MTFKAISKKPVGRRNIDQIRPKRWLKKDANRMLY